jgi:hypothetical protein
MKNQHALCLKKLTFNNKMICKKKTSFNETNSEYISDYFLKRKPTTYLKLKHIYHFFIK